MNWDSFVKATPIDAYIAALDRFVKAERPYRYKYMASGDFARVLDLRERNRVYWFEILERAHCAAISALLRLERWLGAMSVTAASDNFLAFAASFRGLLESAADTRYALGDIPKALASTFGSVWRAVRSELTTLILSPDLEDDLIHFSHGRKLRKSEQAPESHAAKTMTIYLEALEGGASGPVHTCYAELCNVTHPAADSILYLLEKRDDGWIAFSAHADHDAIEDLCTRGSTVMTYAISESLFCPVIILRAINRFGLPELLTPVVEDVPLGHVELWQDIENCLVAPSEGQGH
jgi:hypothetical protein